MVALIAGALASVPASWKEGSAALGRQPLAHDRARVAAHRAPGDRRRDRACHSARARRGDHGLSMVSGSRGFAANPLDGITFLFER